MSDTVQASVSSIFTANWVAGRLRQLAGQAAASRGLMSLVDQTLVSGTTFATSVIIGRWHAEALGVYALCMTVVLLLRNVQGELVAAPFTVYSHRKRGRTLDAYCGSAVAHQAVLCGLGMLLVAVVALVAWRLEAAPRLTGTLTVLLLAAPLLMAANFSRNFCFARLQFGRAAALDGLIAALQVGGLALLAWHNILTVPTAFLVMGVASLAGFVAWLASRSDRLVFRWRAMWADWRRNWRFSRWAMASQLVGCSTPYIVPWAISLAHDEAATGIFAACVTTVGLSTTFVTALANLLTPTSARAFALEGKAGLKRVLMKTVLIYTVVVGAFCLLLAVTGDALVVLFYGGQYAGTGVVCTLLAAGILMNCVSVVAGNGMWAVDKPFWNLPADACVLLATLAAAAWLVPTCGVLGAAVTSLAAATAGAVVRAETLRRLLQRM